jgi:hypothetical protein
LDFELRIAFLPALHRSKQSTSPVTPENEEQPARILLEGARWVQHIHGVRAHGMWTYEPRQGRKAATVVCSTSAVVTLALFSMQNEKLKMNKAGVPHGSAFVLRFFISNF